MAVNDSRSMDAEFAQGVIDRSYIDLTPDRGVVEHLPVQRLSWPTYQSVGQHKDHSHGEAIRARADLPREGWRRGSGDSRY